MDEAAQAILAASTNMVSEWVTYPPFDVSRKPPNQHNRQFWNTMYSWEIPLVVYLQIDCESGSKIQTGYCNPVLSYMCGPIVFFFCSRADYLIFCSFLTTVSVSHHNKAVTVWETFRYRGRCYPTCVPPIPDAIPGAGTARLMGLATIWTIPLGEWATHPLRGSSRPLTMTVNSPPTSVLNVSEPDQEQRKKKKRETIYILPELSNFLRC